MERNFETVMIEQCAPVLAGLKPAGLFRYETRDCADLARRVRSWNEQLASKGLSVRVLKGCVRTHQFLIYVYREARLRAIFADEAVRAFPQASGTMPHPEEQEIVTLVDIDFAAYRRANDLRTVRKNVTLPSWPNDLAERNGVNFSQVLQESLKERLHVSNR